MLLLVRYLFCADGGAFTSLATHWMAKFRFPRTIVHVRSGGPTIFKAATITREQIQSFHELYMHFEGFIFATRCIGIRML